MPGVSMLKPTSRWVSDAHDRIARQQCEASGVKPSSEGGGAAISQRDRLGMIRSSCSTVSFERICTKRKNERLLQEAPKAASTALLGSHVSCTCCRVGNTEASWDSRAVAAARFITGFELSRRVAFAKARPIPGRK